MGAAIAVNRVSDLLTAAISGPATEVRAGKAVTLGAEESGSIAALTVSGGGAGSFAGNASVPLNEISSTSEALIEGGAFVTTPGVVSVRVVDRARIDSLAATGNGAGGAAIGGAVAKNLVSDTGTAAVRASLVDAGSLFVTVDGSAAIQTASLGGAGASGFALVGSISINEIANRFTAGIEAGAEVRADAQVVVRADERLQLLSASGAGAGAAGAAVGAAATYNALTSVVGAHIDASTVDSLGNVIVSAASSPRVLSIAIGGAGAAYFALAGSTVVNDLATTVSAEIRGHSKVSAMGDVLVRADFTTADTAGVPAGSDLTQTADVQTLIGALGVVGINAFAGAGAGAFVGVAGAVTVNLVANTVRAAILDSAVGAVGLGEGVGIATLDPDAGTVGGELLHGVGVLAFSRVDLDAVVIAGAGGLGGFSGVVDHSRIGSLTEALVVGSEVRADRLPFARVVVRALQVTTIDTFVLGLAGGSWASPEPSRSCRSPTRRGRTSPIVSREPT